MVALSIHLASIGLGDGGERGSESHVTPQLAIVRLRTTFHHGIRLTLLYKLPSDIIEQKINSISFITPTSANVEVCLWRSLLVIDIDSWS